MIAFGSPINGGEAYRRYAEPGIERAAEPDSVRLPWRPSTAWRGPTTCCSTRPPRSTASRRSCSFTRTSRSPIRPLSPRSAPPSPIRTSLCSAAPGPPASTASPGGRARSSRGRSRCATRTRRGRDARVRLGGAEPGSGRGRGGRRVTARALAMGGGQSPLRRVADCSAMATTSSSASRPGGGSQGDRRRPEGDLSPVAGADRQARAVDRGARPARSAKLNGRLRPEPPDEAGWRRRARRAEAEREAARSVAFSGALRLDARVAELERELEREDSRAARGTSPRRCVGQPGPPRACASGATEQRPETTTAEYASDLFLGDAAVLGRHPGAHPQRESRSATANALDSQQPVQHRLVAACRCCGLPQLGHPHVPLGDVMHAVGLEPLEQGWRSHGSSIARSRPTTAPRDATRRRSRRTPARRPAGAHRGRRRIPRPRSARRCPGRPRGPPTGIRQAPGSTPGSPGYSPPASPATGCRTSSGIWSRRRSSRRGERGASRRRGTAAAAARARGALRDQPRAPRGPCSSCGRRRSRSRRGAGSRAAPRGWSGGSARAGAVRRRAARVRVGGGVDRGHAGAGPGCPGDQHPRQVAGVGPDLGDRAYPAASRQGTMISASWAIDTPQRAGS